MIIFNNLRYENFVYEEIDETDNKILTKQTYTDQEDFETQLRCFSRQLKYHEEEAKDIKRIFHSKAYSITKGTHVITRLMSGTLDYDYYMNLGN